MNFYLDSRLGIELPDLSTPFESLPHAEQEETLVYWERIRARIPDQIMKFEHRIEDLLDSVHQEEDWDKIAAFFGDISDYASRIHELNTWRRIDQSLHGAPAHDAQKTKEHRDREK